MTTVVRPAGRHDAHTAEDRPRPIARAPRGADLAFRWVLTGTGALVLVITGAIGLFLAYRVIPTMRQYGWSFLTTTNFDPTLNQAGIASAIIGTVEVAIIALVIAVPMAILTALYITEYAPRRLRSWLVSLVDLMAAVPSIVYGAWGFFLLMPQLLWVARWLDTWFGWIPIFDIPGVDPRSAALPKYRFELSAFTAGVVVAMMVIPLACSVMRNVFDQAPAGEREAALALGSTRWGVIRTVVLPFGRGGLIGGTMLGLGRALGETIAVLLVTSQDFHIRFHILDHGSITISALIANRFGDARGVSLDALLAAGFVLFLMTLVVNTFAAMIVARSRSGAGVDL
jgi:phosphate transport system permease protein